MYAKLRKLIHLYYQTLIRPQTHGNYPMTMDIRGTNKPQTPVMFKLISFIFSLISVSYVPLILEFS